MKHPYEAAAASERTERGDARNKQSLHLRLYFRRHMTALVKMVGYKGLSIDETKQRLMPLREEFGDTDMSAACEELVDIDHSRWPHHVTLKQHVLVLVRQILGPPPQPARGKVVQNSALRALDMKCLTSGGKGDHNAEREGD